METNTTIDWKNMSNKKIQENLLSLRNEHESLKTQINKLLDKVIDIEKEYMYGNSILDKRYKGIDE